MRINEDIIGKEVLDSSASIIGKVQDVEYDSAINSLTSLIIITTSSKNFFKSEEKKIKLPFEAIQSIGDKIIIKDYVNELEELLEKINQI